MADVLIKTAQEWHDFAVMAKEKKLPRSDRFYVEHGLLKEFSEWAMRQAAVKGFVVGIVTTLAFVVVLGVIVRLML